MQIFMAYGLRGQQGAVCSGAELQDAAVEYEFTLRYSIENNVDDALERLAAAACTDALVGLGRPGQLCLEFRREAASELDAVVSARADVERALPEAVLIQR